MEPRLDFNERPFIVIWETTQACDLACVHCRACAQPLRNALELTTEEAKRLIDEVRALEAPAFVLTGGDPLKRTDARSPGRKKAKVPLYPKHPERVCWGCDKYCSASSLWEWNHSNPASS